jgi:imidazole glycerol phosphate synthase glutamine amidotransferase subunit
VIVEVVATGTANTASVLAALSRAGVRARISRDPSAIEQAEAVVLPGVGTLSAAMRALRAHGLDEVIRRRVADRRALLAICLGMQILGEESEESPGVAGLGAVGFRIRRLSRARRLPHFGWSAVAADRHDAPASVLVSGEAYFAHSYGLVEVPQGWRAAWSDCGERFVSAIESGPVVACQFHPELSGEYGRGLLSRWIDRARAVSSRRADASEAFT